MSELQLSMIALGAATVVGVLAYNAWQGRRHRRLVETLVRKDDEGVDDVLLRGATGGLSDPPVETPRRRAAAPAGVADSRLEPTLGDLPPLAPGAADEGDVLPRSAIEPDPRAALKADEAGAGRPDAAAQAQLDEIAAAARVPPSDPATPLASPASAIDVAEVEPADAGPALEAVLPPSLLSPAADYIAAFEVMEAVPGDQVLQAQGELMRAVGKRIAWVGYDDTLPGWELCRAGAFYRRLRIGVQLADRNGPLSEAGLDLFYRAMQSFADELTAVADLPPRRAALENAQRLDRICAGVDIQVGVNVVSKGTAFPGTKIRALAEAAGMAIESEGAYVRRDDDGNMLYTLHAHDGVGFGTETMRSLSTHGLTFLLDVPRVAGGDRVFNQMVEVARRFAETLQGQLVDDNRRPINEQFLAPIRKQIGQYQATMATQGLPAGSDVALRLFA